LKNSLISTIGGWLSREPAMPVAVAAFGKSAVVNGHQDLAGDPTKSLLEFARTTYYEGALPNCTTWEGELRNADRVLATHVVRWSGGRLTVARVAAVAEGGATTKAFAPMITCVEVDGRVGIAMMPAIDEALASVEQSLLDARPEKWAVILAPVRAALLERMQRTASHAPAASDAVDAVASEHLARLGESAKVWTESLAEELNLEMPSGGASARVASKVAALGCRTAEAPRTGAGIALDLCGWSAFLRVASPALSEWWLLGGEPIASVRIVAGHPRDREFSLLWRSREAAAQPPQPLPDAGRSRVMERTGTWLRARAIDPKPTAIMVDPTSGEAGGAS
jgi:hypothetical protein